MKVNAVLLSVMLGAVLLSNNLYASFGNSTSLDPINNHFELPKPEQLNAGAVIALNKSVHINGEFLPLGSELIVGENGKLLLIVRSKDQLDENLIDTNTNINELMKHEYTVLEQNEKTGEIEPYYLQKDFEFAGPYSVQRKRGGVTNCYHVVKAMVKDRIELYGVAAYMAAPQLREAGWHRYADYDSAPEGSVCVFNKGGIQTTSGGHIYGHIGVKGASGIANPTSGFHLKRPFLGCWNEV